MLFSILIPAFKSQFLAEAIESCLAQELGDFEVIIVDDHSPEDLHSIVSQYSDKRIKYYANKTNCGAVDVVDNWNICLSYAKGEFVICMGDDDRLLPWCLTEYSLLIQRYPNLDVYHARTELIDEEGRLIGLQEARPEWESAYSALWHQCSCHRKQYIGDFLFRTSSLKNEGGFFKLPLAIFSDNISTIRAAKKFGVANIQKISFQYRVNRYTISNNGDPRLLADSIKSAYDWFCSFLHEEPIDELDRKYVKMLLDGDLRKHIYGMMMYVVSRDLNENGLSAISYWKSHYSTLGINEDWMRSELKLYRRNWYITKFKKLLGE